VGEVADVRPFLRAADIFAFPSRGESFGGALVEAMSCGLACVGLRSDGRGVSTANSEIIEHGRCGLLVDRPEPAAFAAALDDLARDGGRRGLFGEAGRRRACERFTWAAGGRRLNEIISKLVGGAVRSDIQSGQRFDVSTF
jgi:glycosyltransferase involved in cell wall biosynthesis